MSLICFYKIQNIKYNRLKISEGGIFTVNFNLSAKNLILLKCSIEEVSATLANFFVVCSHNFSLTILLISDFQLMIEVKVKVKALCKG